MTPSPEQLEHIRISQRASLRNAQTFSMFATLCASGKRPEEALKDAEAAIDLWSEYEDAHAIEPPESSTLGAMLSSVNKMVETMGERSQQNDLGDLVTEMANALEESVCVLENEGRKTKANKMLLSRIEALVARADIANRNHSAPASTDPSIPANGGSSQ